MQAELQSEKVQFKFVYILEAHATDRWPSPSSRYNLAGDVVNIPTHTTIEERITAAKALMESMEMQGEVLVDTMEDSFNNEYSAWPVMFYAIRGGKLEFKGIPIKILAWRGELARDLRQKQQCGTTRCKPLIMRYI